MGTNSLGGERLYPKTFNEADLAHQGRYQLALRFVKEDDIVLDIACGVGYGAHYIASNSACSSVVAVDISDEALDWGNKYFPSSKIDYRKVDLEKEFASELGIAQYNVITCFETVEHIKEDRAFVAQLAKVLKPGGTLLISAPNEDLIPHENNPSFGGGKNPFHYRHYRSEEFKRFLSDHGFSITDYYTQYRQEAIPGIGGFVNILVCTNIPAQSKVIGDLEQIAHMCHFLKETNNRVTEMLDIASIGIRFNQILITYDDLSTALDLIDNKKFDECLEHLATIDASLCPERYFLEGLAYQGKFDYFKAIEKYSKVISLQDNLNEKVVTYARYQLDQVISELRKVDLPSCQAIS